MLFVMGVRGSSLVEDEGQVRRGWVDEGWVGGDGCSRTGGEKYSA